MAATGYHRGHSMTYDPSLDAWVYDDTGRPVSEDPHRSCGHCGEPPTAEGHDACLGTLPGIWNACCGHGVVKDAYVQYRIREGKHRVVVGESALSFFEKRGRGPRLDSSQEG